MFITEDDYIQVGAEALKIMQQSQEENRVAAEKRALARVASALRGRYDIERASAKIRARGVVDEDEDYDLPIYAERIPVRTVLGAPEPCSRLQPGVDRPASLAGYHEGRPLEDALAEVRAAAGD